MRSVSGNLSKIEQRENYYSIEINFSSDFLLLQTENKICVMRKLLSIIVLSLTTLVVYSQTDSTKYWTSLGDFSVNFNQVSFTNWAAGGDNSVSGVTLTNYDLTYAKGKNSWKNKIILGYGMQYLNEDYKKTEDKIDLSSIYGHGLTNKIDISFLASLKSQFAEGFDKDNDSVAISKFMAPGYISAGLGFNYKPTGNFSLFLSPATAQWVIVNDQRLADLGSFGVAPAEFDANGVKIKDGENVKFQFGASLKASFKRDIAKNVNLETTLELFSDYLDNPQNIDVRWDVILGMTVNKWLSAKITTNLIYDNNITINDKNGIALGPRTQFKEMFGLGFGFKF
jgi:hypothetical protein